MLAERTTERMRAEISTLSNTARSAALAPVTRPATTAKQTMRTFAPMHAALRPEAPRPYRRFRKFKIPPKVIAIPAPKNQTFATGLEDRRNVVAM